MRAWDFGIHRMLGLAVALGFLAVGSTANAASTAFDLSSAAGPGQVRVTLDDGVMPGALKITAEIIGAHEIYSESRPLMGRQPFEIRLGQRRPELILKPDLGGIEYRLLA